MAAGLLRLAEKHPRRGFRKLFDKTRLEGYRWNHKRVCRVHCRLGLNLRRPLKKRLPKRERQPIEAPQAPNECWALDFTSDNPGTGQSFRSLNVIDEFNREALEVEVDTSQETGGLYETGGRAWVHRPTAEVIKNRGYKMGEWTDLELSAIGRNIVVKINGVVSTELKNDKGRTKGYIGLQLHGGQVMHVEYKDIVILEK